MEKVDFIGIADYCKAEFEKEHTIEGRDKYVKTTYAAITEDNKISYSTTPHILENAHKCLLIHTNNRRASTNWYYWYKFQYIDQFGNVHDERLEDGFSLQICYSSYSDQRVYLKKECRELCSFPLPIENDLEFFWNLYNKCRECATVEEAALVGSLAMKDRKIMELERKYDSLTYANELLKRQEARNEALISRLEKALNIADSKE